MKPAGAIAGGAQRFASWGQFTTLIHSHVSASSEKHDRLNEVVCEYRVCIVAVTPGHSHRRFGLFLKKAVVVSSQSRRHVTDGR